MMRSLVMHKLYDDNTSHIGAKLRFFHLYIKDYDELYFIKEIRQAFKFLFIPFDIVVTTSTFKVPSEFIAFMQNVDDLSDEDFSSMNLKEVLDGSVEAFNTSYGIIFNAVSRWEGGEERDDMLENMFNHRRAFNKLVEPWSDGELKLVSTFIDNGFAPMYKVAAGSSTTYYMGKVLDDRIDMVSVEAMNFKDKLVFQSVNQFYFTRKLITEFLKFLDTKKGEQIL